MSRGNGMEANEAYMKVHNVRTLLEIIVKYLEGDDDDAAETVYFALETALQEATSAERVLGGQP